MAACILIYALVAAAMAIYLCTMPSAQLGSPSRYSANPY
jgi:hypothetical protein